MIPVLITARLVSSRLPRKHLLDMGGITVIEHIVLRCEHFGLVPFVCVPHGEQWPISKNFNTYYVGNTHNPEVRVIEIAKSKQITRFHQLDGDDPWFDPLAIRKSIELIKDDRKKLYASALSRAGAARCGTSYNLNGTIESNDFLEEKIDCPWPQRLTLDYQEDHHLISAVNRMVGGYMAPRWAVDDLFIRNPDLHKINWFRTEEWKARQLNENRI